MKPAVPASVLLLLAVLLSGCSDENAPQATAPASENAPVHGQGGARQDTEEPVTENDAPAGGDPVAKHIDDDVTELEWDELIPPQWQPDELLGDYGADDLADDDPRARELLEKLKELWKNAPVVREFNGRRIRLPGFMVPIEADAAKVSEFLLVPYYGACIHVPPPPPNQTVHVVTADGEEYPGELFDTVWVTGTLRVESYSGDLADAGYRIEAESVEPYE